VSKEKIATFHEFGNGVQISVNATDEHRSIAKEMLEKSFEELLEFTPDKVWKEEPRFLESPVVDRLQKFNGIAYRMVFASPIYDYFTRLRNEAVAREKNKTIYAVEHRLYCQSQKSWLTRLCWKLGGFTLETDFTLSWLDQEEPSE
jgi:hypothetical protein